MKRNKIRLKIDEDKSEENKEKKNNENIEKCQKNRIN